MKEWIDSIMKVFCQVIEVDNVRRLEKDGKCCIYQRFIAKDYKDGRSTYAFTVWEQENIDFFKLYVGQNLKVEFISQTYRSENGNIMQSWPKVLSINKLKTTWKPPYSSQDLYIIIRDDKKTMKIGRSNNPKRRLKALQTSNNISLTLFKIYKGCGELEYNIHQELKEKGLHHRGEWFKYCKETFDIVNKYCEQDGKLG